MFQRSAILLSLSRRVSMLSLCNAVFLQHRMPDRGQLSIDKTREIVNQIEDTANRLSLPIDEWMPARRQRRSGARGPGRRVACKLHRDAMRISTMDRRVQGTVQDFVSGDVLTLRRDEPIEHLVRILAESAQDVFPILDDDQKVVGTVSEQDLVRVLSPAQRTFAFGPSRLVREGLMRTVEDVMTPRPSLAKLNEPLESALKRMGDMMLPQLVVVDDNGKLVGILRARQLYCAAFGRRS